MRLPTRAELSEEQEDFLMDAPFDRPVLCTGPPGTGKTVLALYRSVTLADKKQKADLVMFSKLLSRYVERSIEELGLDLNVATWHSWIYKLWWDANRLRMPELEKWAPDFKRAASLIQEEKPRLPTNLYWEHLIVDEGQDFPKEFYLFLTVIRHNDKVLSGRPAPGLTVFADENQRLEASRNSTIEDIVNYLPGIEKFELTINYRNSAPIARLAGHFYVGLRTGIATVSKREKGSVPVLRRFGSFEEEVGSIVNWAYNNSDLSVGVIVVNRETQKKMVKQLQSACSDKNIKIQSYSSNSRVDAIEFYRNGIITVICDKSCKGLEFDAVFIPQLQAYRIEGADKDFFKMKMYVMTSRARQHLQLSFSECDEDPQVLKMLPSHDSGILRWKL